MPPDYPVKPQMGLLYLHLAGAAATKIDGVNQKGPSRQQSSVRSQRLRSKVRGVQRDEVRT